MNYSIRVRLNSILFFYNWLISQQDLITTTAIFYDLYSLFFWCCRYFTILSFMAKSWTYFRKYSWKINTNQLIKVFLEFIEKVICFIPEFIHSSFRDQLKLLMSLIKYVCNFGSFENRVPYIENRKFPVFSSVFGFGFLCMPGTKLKNTLFA